MTTIFGGNGRHGIFREVAGLAADAPVKAWSETAPDGVELSTGSSGTRIRVGDPARTITGRHRYTIDYPIAGIASNGQLTWVATGTGLRQSQLIGL